MPLTQQVEHVLVVPTLLFREVGYFQGFCTDVEPYLKTLLDPAYISFRPRDQMENDPSFKQLIPYCLFRYGDQLFHYKRGKLQGEGRLHSKRSIGVGRTYFFAGPESVRFRLPWKPCTVKSVKKSISKRRIEIRAWAS